MTFQSSRNAATNALRMVENNDGLQREQALQEAQAHIALAQAEAFHELATSLGNVAQAIAQGRR